MKTLSLHRAFEPWLVTATAHAALVEALAGLAPQSFFFDDEEDKAEKPDYSVMDGGVAVLPVNGMTCVRPSRAEKKYLGMTCTQEIGEAMDRAMTDPRVNALVLQFGSPGGTANGSPELADRVRAYAERGGKPVVAFTDSVMASAAYQVGSQANAVIATRSATVGSIGTVISFLDVSKAYEQMGIERKVITNDGATFKGAGIPGTKLTPEQEAQIKRVANAHGEMFKRTVKARRPGVADDTMRGQTFVGDEALSVGLIDEVGSLDRAIKTASALRAMRR
jgi:signal peptide peptidase SppA